MKNFYKISVFVLVFLTAPVGLIMAQDFLPALNDNFMGINQATLQPAAIVDSRSNIDVNLFGYSSDMYNNMYHFETIGLMRPLDMINDEDWWEDNHNLAAANGKDKAAYVNAGILGPSVLVTINEKHAVGFTYRMRQVLNVEGIGEQLARSIDSDFEDPAYFQQWYHEENVREVQNIFADYGLSYATEVYNEGEHYIKTGLTVKLLQGMGGAYFEAEDLYFYAYNETA